MIYQKFIRPVLSRVTKKDPEAARRMVVKAMKFLGNSEFFRKKMGRLTFVHSPALRQNIFGIRFNNPVGLAAGFNRNAEITKCLDSLGFGFATVGSITSDNAGEVALRLLAQRQEFSSALLGVSIERSEMISLNEAVDDYLRCFRSVYALGDYFEISQNIQELQERYSLKHFLESIKEARIKLSLKGGGGIKPILIKISPDINGGILNDLLDGGSVDGVIVADLSLVKRIYNHTYGRLPIIAAGGIFTAKDAYEMLKAGASLVQISNEMISEGPFIARNINRGLVKIFKKEGFGNISDLRGKNLEGCYMVRHQGCRRA